jgi:hypothetical protein
MQMQTCTTTPPGGPWLFPSVVAVGGGCEVQGGPAAREDADAQRGRDRTITGSGHDELVVVGCKYKRIVSRCGALARGTFWRRLRLFRQATG